MTSVTAGAAGASARRWYLVTTIVSGWGKFLLPLAADDHWRDNRSASRPRPSHRTAPPIYSANYKYAVMLLLILTGITVLMYLRAIGSRLTACCNTPCAIIYYPFANLPMAFFTTTRWCSGITRSSDINRRYGG